MVSTLQTGLSKRITYVLVISFNSYSILSSDACKYIAEDSRANILVVEDEKQLEKVLKFKSEVPFIKVSKFEYYYYYYH